MAAIEADSPAGSAGASWEQSGVRGPTAQRRRLRRRRCGRRFFIENPVVSFGITMPPGKEIYKTWCYEDC